MQPSHTSLCALIEFAEALHESRPFALLILAYGLARCGDADKAKQLQTEAAAVLAQGDAIQQHLGRLYGYRIEQLLAGKSPEGPLPAELLQAGEFGGDNTRQGHMDRYKVRVFRAMSRIVEPAEQVNPYWVFEAPFDGDTRSRRLLQIQQQYGEAFASNARELLHDSQSASLEKRRDVLSRLAGVGRRGGDAFCVELLGAMLELIRSVSQTHAAIEPMNSGLIAQALTLATTCRKPDVFKLLVDEAIAVLTARKVGLCRGNVHQLMVEAERGFRTMALRDEAQRFLEEVASMLPEAADPVELEKRWGDDWACAARMLLAEEGIREVATRAPASRQRLDLIRDVIFAPQKGQFLHGHLASEYASACGRLRSTDAAQRIEELLARIVRIPDTRTTAAQFSHLLLGIFESVVLGICDSEIG